MKAQPCWKAAGEIKDILAQWCICLCMSKDHDKGARHPGPSHHYTSLCICEEHHVIAGPYHRQADQPRGPSKL